MHSRLISKSMETPVLHPLLPTVRRIFFIVIVVSIFSWSVVGCNKGEPDVEYIEGLSPAVSIDQKGASHNPRSTVGTVTEVYDYLRLLFARVGVPHCPICGREVARQSAQEVVERVEKIPEGSRLLIMAPIIRITVLLIRVCAM